ncbi:hypothetical protein ILUMI_02447 [Ignelater luminosus]|uniref:Uncharacterized protein n=1 Tax=Ignelater luminosus TaxID=2038154 RepID=A0A8K0DGH4_IGNLU|nr:hypothetical protein ILUMI_02447 [Ignelater luminosus]
MASNSKQLKISYSTSNKETNPYFEFGLSDLKGVVKMKAFVDKTMPIKQIFKATSTILITAPHCFESRNCEVYGTTEIDGDVSNIPSTSQETNILVDLGTETQHYDELEVYSLRKKIKSLKQNTLYFYSPKAYNFVRWYFILPNPQTICKWLCKVNRQPGFLMEVLEFLKEEVKWQPNLKQCALNFDSTSSKKQVIYDNKEGRFVGNIDYGGVVDTDFENAATEALFFQIVI